MEKKEKELENNEKEIKEIFNKLSDKNKSILKMLAEGFLIAETKGSEQKKNE